MDNRDPEFTTLTTDDTVGFEAYRILQPARHAVQAGMHRTIRHLCAVQNGKPGMIAVSKVEGKSAIGWRDDVRKEERETPVAYPDLVDACTAMGKFLPQTYGVTDTGDNGILASYPRLLGGLKNTPELPLTWPAMLQVMLFLSWRDNRFPGVRVTEDQLADLVTTKTSPELFADMVVPWDTFVIEVPPGMLHAETGWGVDAIRYIMVRQEIVTPDGIRAAGLEPDPKYNGAGERRWWYIAFGERGFSCIMGTCINDEALAREPTENAEFYRGDGRFYRSVLDNDVNRMNMLLIGRLIFGICFEYSAHRVTPVAKRRPADMNSVRWAQKQKYLNQYVMLRDVKRSDLVADIKDVSLGIADHSVTVRTIVCRHRKMQPCGPGRKERKLIVVEPYERGLAASKVGVRQHTGLY